MWIQSIKTQGFGEYALPSEPKAIERTQALHLIAHRAMWVHTITYASLGVLALTSVVTLPSVSVLMIMAIEYIAALAFAHLTYWNYRSVAAAFYGVSKAVVQDSNSPRKMCKGFACSNTIESFSWKKKLIENAQHSIVLSGNYCGGESFDEILDIMKQRLQDVAILKVVILSSPTFITPTNQEKISQLQGQYPDRFQFVSSPDIIYVNPGIKKTTNHTKALVIDGGRYFLLGGSGVEDKYAFSDGLTLKKKTIQNEQGVLEWFLPKGFRDMDFVFNSRDAHSGRDVYLEILKLAYRWEGLDYLVTRDVFSQNPEEFLRIDTVARSLLRSDCPEANTFIKSFEETQSHVMPIEIFCTGPEMTKNSFEEAIIQRLEEAKNSIFIDHMYFHPSDRVFDALANAINRGVKFQIVTNGNHHGSPGSHQLFGDRNRYNYVELLQRVKPEFSKNVHIYEFNVKDTTLHKKVMVIDNHVISGSGNLGYKSLETMSDHEMNFVTESLDFAQQVIKILEVDCKIEFHAEKIMCDAQISFGQRLYAARHRILAPFIG